MWYGCRVDTGSCRGEHCVTVRDADFEYQGRPFKSLSSIARAITGTRWNGWVFFGLKSQGARR